MYSSRAAGGDDLSAFFEAYYPGIFYTSLVTDTPQELAKRLEEF